MQIGTAAPVSSFYITHKFKNMKKMLTIGGLSPHAVKKALLVMKLTSLLIFVAALQVSANVNGQGKVSLKLHDVEISKALNAIEKQGTYRFLYNSRLDNIHKKITVDESESPVGNVLNKLFTGTALTYKMLDNNLIVVLAANKVLQDIKITGTITGDNGEPLANVSVSVKGSARGTATDNTGSFTLLAPEDGTLLISYIGYVSQEVPVKSQSVFNVKLTRSAIQMDQVVVVGYGTQRRRDLTGSVASVSGADIAKQPVLTATQAIQGKVAGVQIISSGDPNSNPTVQIRGVGTMLGGASPLFVVDGVITDDIRNINSADIVSMDILKDASATAIYGMRAANGVLLITTKKGRPGKMVVAYDGTVGVKEIAKLVNMAGAKQYANYVNEANLYYGTLDTLVTNAQLTAGGNTDWYDAITKRSLQQNHNISLSGGNDAINYFLSAGYIGDGGVIQTNNFKRFTLRSNNEYKLSSKLRLSTLLSYSRTNLRDVNLDVFNIAYRAAPYVPAKVGGLYGNTSLSNNISNPLLLLDKNNASSTGNRIQGTGALEYKPVSWLTLRSSMGVDINFYNNITYNYKYDNTGDNSIFIEPGGNQLVNRSKLAVQNDNANKWVWDNTATIAKTFDKHNLSLLMGITSEQYKFNTTTGTRLDVPENPDQWYLYQGTDTTATAVNIGDKWSRNSYLARLFYSYDNRYMITGTFRADGTSRFPSQNRWGYFPSVGLAWNITKEAFMSSQNTFNNLKLRGSWGKVGNDQINSNLYTALATPNVPYVFNGGQYYGISFDQAVDKNLKWEITQEYDLGLDFAFLDNRLSGTIDAYSKKTKDALINVTFNGQYLGSYGTYTTNAASFTNKGLELSLNWNDKINADWSYNVSGNIAFNKNKIIGLNGGAALFDGTVGSYATTKSDNGHPIGSFYMLQANGIFQNAAEIAASAQTDARPGDLRYKDISGPDGKPDGKIDDYDRDYSGSYQPKFTYGVSGGLSYKTFDFSFNTYGTSGGKIYNGKRADRANSADNIETDVAKNRWTPNHTNTNVPRANLNALPASTYFLESGSFFRINNLTLGYTLPRALLSRYKVQNLRFFVTAQNLATFTGYSGFTPELASTKSTTANGLTTVIPSALNAGIEYKIYPTTRSFAFGVNLGF
jgi:TonB-linked SusC/RagA family outer membrane protein